MISKIIATVRMSHNFISNMSLIPSLYPPVPGYEPNNDRSHYCGGNIVMPRCNYEFLIVGVYGSNTLQTAQVPIVSKEVCGGWYRQSGVLLPQDHFCAG